MVKSLHYSCISHEPLFYMLQELSAIKQFCKAGHLVDLRCHHKHWKIPEWTHSTNSKHSSSTG